MNIIYYILIFLVIASCSESKINVKVNSKCNNSNTSLTGEQIKKCEALASSQELNVVLKKSIDGKITNQTSIEYIATFSSEVDDFKVDGIEVVNGTVKELKTQDNLIYTIAVQPTIDGVVSVSIPSKVAIAKNKKKNSASETITVIYDGTAPTISLASTSTPTTATTPIAFTANFSESVSGFALEDIIVSNGTATNLSGSGSSYAFDIVPSGNGTVTADISNGAAFDDAGNTNTAATQVSRIYDSQNPAITLTSGSTSVTNSSPIAVTATFSKIVTGFVAGDITVTNGTVSGFSGSGDTYNFNVTPSGNGAVSLSVASGVAVSSSNQVNTASATLTRTYDTVSPTVALTSSSSSSVNAAFSVTATFSESVTGFALGDISLTNAAATSLSGSGTTYTFTVTPMTAGTVAIDIPASSAQDSATNNNTAATQLSRTYDITVPTVALTSSAASNINAAFSVTATFSESVTGFTIGDIVVTNGTASNFSGSGTTYTFDVAPTAGGTVAVDISANGAQDAATNNNTAATQLTRTYDNTAPTVTLSSSTASSFNSSSFTVTATFSESVTGFVVGDIAVSNGSASNFSGSGTTYTFDVTPSANGAVNVNIAANVASDASANNNTAATQLTRTYDTVAPTASITSATTSPTLTSSFTVTISLSESSSNFAVGDLTISNGTASFFSGSAAFYSFTLTPASEGTVTVNIAGAVFTDAAGNSNTAASQYSITYDLTSPPPPSSLSCSGIEDMSNLTWTTGGDDTVGYVIARNFGSAFSWAPTAGTTYSTANQNNISDYQYWLTYSGTATSYADPYVFPGMTHYYRIFAYDGAKNYSSAVEVNCTVLPVAMIESPPPASSNISALNLTVSGQNVAEYKYALIAGEKWCSDATYSSWISKTTAITDATFSGPNRLCVLGRTSGWDTQVSATQIYFINAEHVSFIHPTNWNSRVQLGDNFKIEWEDHNSADNSSGTIALYYSSTATGSCSAGTLITSGILQSSANRYYNWSTSGVSEGSYYICIDSYNGTTTKSIWSQGVVTIENYCTGAKLTNTLASSGNGDGSSSNPYMICTLTQLDEMRSMTQTGNYYELRRDIDASATSSWNSGAGWLPTTYAAASFEGNGYTISGLTINRSSTDYVGMFTWCTATTSNINNIRLASVNIVGKNYTGALFGLSSKGTMSKIYVSGSITGLNSTGAVLGATSTSYSVTGDKWWANATVTGSAGGTEVGGVLGSLGDTASSLTNIEFSGTVSSNSNNLGGIAGASLRGLESCISRGTITSSGSASQYIGGVIGRHQPSDATLNKISGCMMTGSLTASGFTIGGITNVTSGTATARITRNYTSGTITATGAGGNIGGIIGSSSIQNIVISSSGSIGAVTAANASSVAGIIGRSSSSSTYRSIVFQSFAKGTIQGAGGVGGILGGNGASSYFLLQACYSTATIQNYTNSGGGGIAGYVYGTSAYVRDSYSTGNAIAMNSGGNYIGGAMGEVTDGRVYNSYASGNVYPASSVAYGGGFVGKISLAGKINGVFSVGAVTATNAGGLYGYQAPGSSGEVANSYWHKPSGNTQNCGAYTGVSGIISCGNSSDSNYFESSSNAPMTSWDFTTMWKMPSSAGMPILQWQN